VLPQPNRSLSHSRHRCRAFKLAVDPCAEIAEYKDAFANRAHSMSIKPPYRKLVIVADSMVQRFVVPGEYPQQTTFAAYLSEDESRTTQYRDFLNSSQYVPFSPRLRKFFWSARPQMSEDVANYASRTIESACRLGKHLASAAYMSCVEYNAVAHYGERSVFPNSSLLMPMFDG
jgi:hypothetical protein